MGDRAASGFVRFIAFATTRSNLPCFFLWNFCTSDADWADGSFTNANLRISPSNESYHIHKTTQTFEDVERNHIIKGVTLSVKVKSVDIRKELGVNSIKDKVREMRLRWYDTCREWKKTTEIKNSGCC